jgi:heptosyltransferase-3
MHCLFIKPKMIGDALLLTPTLHAVRRRHPDAMIDVLVRRGSESILEGCTAHNHVLLTAQPNTDGVRMRWLHDWADLRALRRQSYDWIFECSGTDRGRFLMRLARGRHRAINRRELELQNSWASRRFWLAACSDTVSFEWSRRHAIERNYLLVRDFLDLPPEPPALEYRPERFDAGSAHLNVPTNFALSPDRLVIHCGTRMPSKAWPGERWQELVAALAPKFAQIFLSVGPSPEEHSLSRRLAALNPSKIFCPEEPLPWSQLAALLQGARLFVGVDTAAMHLASACRCPSVVIWGPISAMIFGPSGADSVIVLDDRVVHPPFGRDTEHDEPRLASRNSTATVLRAALELADRTCPSRHNNLP